MMTAKSPPHHPSVESRKPNRLAKSAAISSVAVMGSRVLGLVREQAFAYFFGASREYDAFLTAFRIPNLLRDLLAEGALSTALVTVFSKTLAKEGKLRAFDVANSVMNCLAIVLFVLVGAGIFFAPVIVGGIALGFDADKAQLTSLLTRTMFPYIFFAAMSACCMGMLNALGRFGLPQSASTFFNVVSIVAGLGLAALFAPEYMAALWRKKQSDAAASLFFGVGVSGHLVSGIPAATRAMLGMACGTLLGGLAQWCVQMPLLVRLGWRWRPRIRTKDPALHDVLRLMGPAVLGAGAVQFSVFINSNFASTLGDKPISWLSYSFRLMQLPIGVFGVAVMTATLPLLSRHAAAGEHESFGATLTEGLELVLCLTLPAAIGLAVLAEPILRMLFEHGRFDPTDTRACALALGAYAVGLPAYSALKVVQPAFVAQGDARTPMWVSLIGVSLSIPVNALLVWQLGWGHVGLALSTSMMALGSTTTLLIVMERRKATLGRQVLLQQGMRIACAGILMGSILAFGLSLLNRWGWRQGASKAAFELAVLFPLGGLVYLAVGYLFKIAALARLAELISRRSRRQKMG